MLRDDRPSSCAGVREPGSSRPRVSVVIPMFNEEETAAKLHAELVEVSAGWGFTHEFVFVDDGSTDRTRRVLESLIAGDPRFTLVVLARNFGQTAGMAAGFRSARGDVIVPMDGDMQNDPRDVPMLVSALDEGGGYDVVSGWRKNRQDKLMSRRLPSVLANRMIAHFTWTKIHDFGCSMKAYRREVLDDIHIYGEMHRFLPALCKWRGARVTERVVNHRSRTAGRSKYDLRRTLKVVLDLITVKFLGDYLTKPLYFFAKVSAAVIALSAVSMVVAVLQKFNVLYWGDAGLNLNDNVLVDFSFMLFILGVHLLAIGVVSELLVRIYHESQGRTPYRVRAVVRGRALSAGTPEGAAGNGNGNGVGAGAAANGSASGASGGASSSPRGVPEPEPAGAARG